MLEVLALVFFPRHLARLARDKGRSPWRWGALGAASWSLGELVAFALARAADLPLAAAYQVALSAAVVFSLFAWALALDLRPAGEPRPARPRLLDRLRDRDTLALRTVAALLATVVVAVVAPAQARWTLTALAAVTLWLAGPRGAAAVGSGALLAALAPPLNIHWLHWVAYLPMFWALRHDDARGNRWLAFAFGTSAVFFIFSWISDTIIIFSNIPALAAYGITALFAVGFGLPYLFLWSLVHPLRRRLGGLWILAVPSLMVVIEFVSIYVILFPYNQGVSQYRVPWMIQLVSLTGILGITWLLLFANAALAEGLYRRREGRPFPVRWVVAAAVTVAAVLTFGAVRHQRVEAVLAEAPVVRVAQMQTHMDMVEVMSRQHHKSLEDWLRETRKLPMDGSVDLVIWPEGAGPHNPSEWRHYGPALGRLCEQGGFELVVGGGWWEIEPVPDSDKVRAIVFNSIFFLMDDGKVHDRYDKLVPLPFGEYIPFAETFPWLREVIRGPGNFRAGTEAVVFEGEMLRIAAPICYEAILPRVCRRYPDPNLFVNVTNDAWFGDTAAPHQHAMLATIRATELGVPLVRIAYTGVSLATEPHGRIYAETEPFEDVNRVIEVRLGTVPTLYAAWGDWFELLCLLGLLGALGWIVARGTRPQK